MLLPQTPEAAFLTSLLSLVCWGSWTNLLVATKGCMRFELFYLEYSISTFVTSMLAALTLGMVVAEGSSGKALVKVWPDDFTGIAATKYISAVLAGVSFNAANIALCKGIEMLGLALAFPLCIGTSMVEGVALTYAIQPAGNPHMLFGGVFVAFCAVCLAAVMQRLKEKQLATRSGSATTSIVSARDVDIEGNSGEAAAPPSMARKLLVCIGGGLLMGVWPCLSTNAGEDPGGLSPFGCLALYTLAAMLSSFIFIPLIIAFPLEGNKGSRVWPVLQELRQTPMLYHTCAWIGGIVWATGTLANAMAGESGQINSAAALAIGQCANVAAILWGIFLFKEFRGTKWDVQVLVVVVLALYAGAISLISLAS